GYAINYNSNPYQGIVTQLASQPPYVVSNTALGTLASPLPLAEALTLVTPGTVTNTYAVDPNYRVPRLELWNVDFQHDFARTINVGVGYTGSRGTHLDIVRAPNRGPNGLRIAGVQPFLYESSEGESTMNALTLRIRRRLTHGLAASASYTLS